MNIEIIADNADFLKQAIYRLVDNERAKLSKDYYSRSVLAPVTITPSQQMLDHIDIEVSYSPILEQATVKASKAKYSQLFNCPFKRRLANPADVFSIQNPRRFYPAKRIFYTKKNTERKPTYANNPYYHPCSRHPILPLRHVKRNRRWS